MDRSIEEALRGAAYGLTYRSETLEEFDAFTWPADGELTPEKVRKLGGHPEDAPVRVGSLERFFADMTTEQDWHDERDKEAVRKARVLETLIKKSLEKPQVFRVGDAEVTIYIVGRTPEGAWAGLTTFAVET